MAIAGHFRNSVDLVNETLANLGVLVAGQTADVEDFNYVNEKLDAVLRKLSDLEVCDIPDQNNIPGQWYSDLADILAGECCTKFGSSGDEYVKLINKGLGGVQGVDVGQGAAAKSLRQMRRGRPTGEILKSHYF
jgi:hypothetical protein